MNLTVKNMVCPRCISAVERVLSEQGFTNAEVKLGEVTLADVPSPDRRERLAAALQYAGFELLDDQRGQLIEKIRNLLIQKVQSGEIEDHFSVSKFLTEHIYKDYSSLSKLFSAVEGITIEQYFILQKIEKVKEWLMYREQSLGEIALSLGYSSSQHLSNQFKRFTGMTPSEFRVQGASLRKSIDSLGASDRKAN